MKKLILFAIITIISTSSLFSQNSKFAYIYSEKVFKSMPAYETAMKEIDQFAKYGSETSKSKLAEVESMFKDFRTAESSMSQSGRDQRKNEIIAKEKEANKYQEDFFSEDGVLAKKQQELMKPIEDKVLSAVNAIATEKGFDMIFDLSTSKVTIYQTPSLDMTNEVINRIK